MVDVMPRLKAETRPEHLATERTELAQAILYGRLTVPEYKAQLLAFHDVHEAIDRAVARTARTREVAGPSARTPRLASDIEALASVADLRGPAFEEASASLVAHVDGADEAQLLGIVYVMEGSTLGAAILYPRIKEHLALPDEAMSYYCGDGSASLDRWRAFGARMNASLLDAGEQDRAVEAARATFVALRLLFDAIRPPSADAERPTPVPQGTELRS
jgi:heme oxygenase